LQRLYENFNCEEEGFRLAARRHVLKLGQSSYGWLYLEEVIPMVNYFDAGKQIEQKLRPERKRENIIPDWLSCKNAAALKNQFQKRNSLS